MPSPIRRRISIVLPLLHLFVSTAYAQSIVPAPRLRPESAAARALVDDLLAQSATGRALAARLEASDALIYVRLRWFATDTIDGHIGFASPAGSRRLLIIELACRRTRQQQLVALGHELRHAVEIADQRAVVDTASLAAFYRRVGEAVSVAGAVEAFETAAAVDAARRVRAELAAHTPTESNSRARGDR